MWIRNQEKTLLIDAKSFHIESAFHIEPENKWSVMTNTGRYDHVLGTYNSKEKAIDVLDDIVHELLNINPADICQCIVVFEMPLEEDMS